MGSGRACTASCTASQMHCCTAVLGIRGTLSLDDCLTDFMCEPADMDAWIREQQAHEPHEVQTHPTNLSASMQAANRK